MAPTLATAVTLDPWLLASLVLVAAWYALGFARIRRGIGAPAACAFAAGIVVLALALVWPLDALGDWSLAAHMAQHMALVAFAPPLLVAGRAPAAFAAAATAPVLAAARAARGALRPLTRPAAAMLVQAAVVWAWHAPGALAAALRSDALHIAMHGTFVAAGIAFWTGVLAAARSAGAASGAALAALAGTMVQMGLLGALLTFGPVPRYAHYVERSPGLGLAPLADQQLAGLIMWVPGCVPYLLGAVSVAAVWLSRAERADRRASH